MKIYGKSLLKDVIRNLSDFYGDKEFFTYVSDFDKEKDETYTYKDMHIISNRLANGFNNIGIKRGNGIALINMNSPDEGTRASAHHSHVDFSQSHDIEVFLNIHKIHVRMTPARNIKSASACGEHQAWL